MFVRNRICRKGTDTRACVPQRCSCCMHKVRVLFLHVAALHWRLWEPQSFRGTDNFPFFFLRTFTLNKSEIFSMERDHRDGADAGFCHSRLFCRRHGGCRRLIDSRNSRAVCSPAVCAHNDRICRDCGLWHLRSSSSSRSSLYSRRVWCRALSTPPPAPDVLPQPCHSLTHSQKAISFAFVVFSFGVGARVKRREREKRWHSHGCAEDEGGGRGGPSSSAALRPWSRHVRGRSCDGRAPPQGALGGGASPSRRRSTRRRCAAPVPVRRGGVAAAAAAGAGGVGPICARSARSLSSSATTMGAAREARRPHCAAALGSGRNSRPCTPRCVSCCANAVCIRAKWLSGGAPVVVIVSRFLQSVSFVSVISFGVVLGLVVLLLCPCCCCFVATECTRKK